MNHRYRCSFVDHSFLRFVVAAAFLAITLTTEALQHNYYTRRDDRSLIGPIGFPFGFLENGHFNLTVFDFKLSATNKPHKHDSHSHGRSLVATDDANCDSKTGICLSDVLKNVDGVGFLLKQFDDEAHFNHYMAYVKENGNCIFQKYLDLKKNSPFTDDDTDDDYNYQYEDDYYDKMYGDDPHGWGLDGYDEMYSDDRQGSDFDDQMRDFDDQMRDFDDQMHDDFREDDGAVRSLQQQIKRQRRQDEEGLAQIIDAVEDGIYLDMLPRSRWTSDGVNVAYNFEEGQAGFYFLIYQVCFKTDADDSQALEDDKIYDIHSRFKVVFHFSNQDMFGHTSYLSSGEMILPWLYFLFSLIYAICLYIWHFNIQLIKDGKPGYFDSGDAPAPPAIPGAAATPTTATIYPIHYLMGFLLALKFCTLIFESIRYHYLRVSGHAVFSSAVYYTFSFLKGMTLFTVILLIGSGWSFVKPFLTDREKKMILGVLILQVINNIAIVVLTQETEGEIAFDRWTAILHLVDIVCCCAVLMPIVWQVNQLEKNMEQNRHKGNEDGNTGGEEASFINGQFDDYIPENEFEDIPTDDDESSDATIPDARMAAKLKLFRSFYMLVIAYIYMTRIVVYLFAATLNYKHTWIPIFVIELCTAIFYVSIGYMFRPMNENPYTHIGNRKPDKRKQSQVEMRTIDPSTKTALD